MGPRGLVIIIALALDLLVGDPPNQLHPVVLMGRWLSWGRRLAPVRSRFWFGLGWTLAGLALFAGPWWAVKRRVTRSKSAKFSFLQGNGVKLRLLSHRARFTAKSRPPPNLPLLGGGIKPSPLAGQWR